MVGFEPTVPFGTSVFKTAALSHAQPHFQIFSHPANCRIMLHSKNKTKHSKCDISLTQLLEDIHTWDQKHFERRNGLEPLTFSLEN